MTTSVTKEEVVKMVRERAGRKRRYIHQGHMALEERESRLIAEVTQLRAELSCGEEAVVHSHPVSHGPSVISALTILYVCVSDRRR